jgi:putative SOS response-associated peptidase YedK
MCGRYTLTITDIAALAAAWGAEVDAALAAAWRPRFNVAPGHRVPLLTGGRGARRLGAATFGLPAPRGGLLLNARAETAARKPTFRDAMARSRAAVPVDGFYEWEGPPAARRPSWFHRPGGAPFLLAALAVPGPDGAPAFAILTTGAVEPVRRLHDRMPVILPDGLVDGWLADGPAPPLPAPEAGWLEARAVSPRVNSPRVDDAACLEPPPPPAPPPQLTLF